MKFTLTQALALIGASALSGSAEPAKRPAPGARPYGLVIHGGAGVIVRKEMTAQTEAAYRDKLAQARDAGYAVLERGGSATDAVVAAVRVMEDSPLFNAGYGAVLDSDGVCELDAAIMDGRTLGAGAVAGVQTVKNPILLAKAIMERSPHVMLAGPGAERFAKEAGLEIVPNSYFRTERRMRELERARQQERQAPGVGQAADGTPPGEDRKWGTVGCVALDRDGNLAAGTSTGGMTNKKFGRVGDSPIIGAGTYANNATCAVSCTGHGEFFMRGVVGHDISARMEYGALPLAEAAARTLAKLGDAGGTGGLVAIGRDGAVAMPFNTPGMYRALRISTGESLVRLFGDER